VVATSPPRPQWRGIPAASHRSHAFGGARNCRSHGSHRWRSAAPPPTGAAQPATAASDFSRAELDKILAPIALYPGALSAQTLPASAYPIQMVQARVGSTRARRVVFARKANSLVASHEIQRARNERKVRDVDVVVWPGVCVTAPRAKSVTGLAGQTQRLPPQLDDWPCIALI
jgi:Protein of unknown function (DUF3300)